MADIVATMVEVNGVTPLWVRVSESGPFPNSVDLRRQMETKEGKDSRLSVVELSLREVQSNLREVQDSVRVWTGIVQEGLADLSMKIKVITHGNRSVERQHLTSVTEDSERLSKVEQQLHAMETSVHAYPDLVARISMAERQLKELQANIQESENMQVSKIKNVEHSCTLTPASSSARMQKDAKSMVTPSCRPLVCRSSQQQPHVQHHDGVQTLLEKMRPPWLQARQRLQTHTACLPQQQQDDNEHDGAIRLAREQTAPNPVQHRSGVANSMPREPKMISPGMLHEAYPGICHGVSQRVTLQPRCTHKQSLQGQHLSRQPAGILLQPSSCQASAWASLPVRRVAAGL